MVFFKPLFSGLYSLLKSVESAQIVAHFVQCDTDPVGALIGPINTGMACFVVATFFSFQKFDTAVLDKMQLLVKFLAIFLPDMAAADRMAVQKHIFGIILFSPAGAAAMALFRTFFRSKDIQYRQPPKLFPDQFLILCHIPISFQKR
jgi:hypothetical protein